MYSWQALTPEPADLSQDYDHVFALTVACPSAYQQVFIHNMTMHLMSDIRGCFWYGSAGPPITQRAQAFCLLHRPVMLERCGSALWHVPMLHTARYICSIFL